MYLVIGGSGFIGTRLCKRLKERNNKFTIIDKSQSKTFPEETKLCNICDHEELLDLQIDASIIVNLAAEHRDDVRPKTLYDKVNVEGAKHVCHLAERKNINTIIFTSSVAVYGFAEKGTDETGKINPFNDYGRTKYEAENIYREWQQKDPSTRNLVIIRPTVIFGEQNRGNVYNLLNQIASGKFVMIGDGENIKSMAYVENIAAFIEYTAENCVGTNIYNYIDKPDYNMNQLVLKVKKALNKEPKIGFRLPYIVGLISGYCFDLLSLIVRKNLPVSAIRIKKFCKDSTYNTTVHSTGFSPPVDLGKAIYTTIKYEFVDKKTGEIFYSE